MTGSEFKRIRTISGFTAKEFAESIRMSTSYVYSLEALGKKEITPRREEEFIEFLGASVYAKSRRIYELEVIAREKYLREQEERRIQQEKEDEEQEERERIERQNMLQEKKLKREAELEEEIKAMESRIYTPGTENMHTDNREKDAIVPDSQPDDSSTDAIDETV